MVCADDGGGCDQHNNKKCNGNKSQPVCNTVEPSIKYHCERKLKEIFNLQKGEKRKRKTIIGTKNKPQVKMGILIQKKKKKKKKKFKTQSFNQNELHLACSS